MKHLTILTILMIMGLGIMAQEEEDRNKQEYRTLFGGTETSNGGYGGISVNYTQIDGQDAILVGARGAWVINHSFALGIGGYGFANDVQYQKTINGYTDNFQLAGGYGGLIIEPIIGAKWPVHVSIPILIGAGGITYISPYYNSYSDPYYYYPMEADAFFVLEPGIEIELNMVNFMRLAIGGYYRYTSDVNLADTDRDVLKGFSAGVTLKFGKF